MGGWTSGRCDDEPPLRCGGKERGGEVRLDEVIINTKFAWMKNPQYSRPEFLKTLQRNEALHIYPIL